MVMSQSSVLKMAREHFPSWKRQTEHAQMLDKWIKGRQLDVDIDSPADPRWNGSPYLPDGREREYTDLVSRSATPWAGLIVTTLAQTAYVDGVRRPDAKDNLAVWTTWQRNRMDARQIPLHRGAAGHGVSFMAALPGRDRLTNLPMAVTKGYSAKRMAAFYDEDEGDEFPRFAIMGDKWADDWDREPGYSVQIFDESAVHYVECKGEGVDGKDWSYVSHDEHGLGVCPVVRYANRLDLDGDIIGEIEPIVPLLRRIDQTTFDRLIVQRFGAWKVRYIAGLAKPSPDEAIATAIQLKIQDLLISDNPNTKFGTLDETQIKGFIESGDADLRFLSAVSQTPPHHLLGLSSNLQAEALATAESGLMRKSDDFTTINGESHETLFRLMAYIEGRRDEANSFDMEVRWRDKESRSMIQAANALSILATGLKVPVEMLWERIPGWTDNDSKRAKKLVEDGSFERLLAELGVNPDAEQAETQSTGGSDNEPKDG